MEHNPIILPRQLANQTRHVGRIDHRQLSTVVIGQITHRVLEIRVGRRRITHWHINATMLRVPQTGEQHHAEHVARPFRHHFLVVTADVANVILQRPGHHANPHHKEDQPVTAIPDKNGNGERHIDLPGKTFECWKLYARQRGLAIASCVMPPWNSPELTLRSTQKQNNRVFTPFGG